MGANVPDLRGLFLRGQGGNSGSLETQQDDAVRTGYGIGELKNILTYGRAEQTGIFKSLSYGKTRVMSDGSTDDWTGTVQNIEVNLSGGFSESNEFRPINMAVRYLIRAIS